MPRRQHGFTLVEIAIVLVIIGLLLVGVLKGQELINSAKVKNLANDFRTTPVFIYGYQDKFKRLPGDDPDAATRFASTGGLRASATGQTQGNGIIEGVWNSTDLGSENLLFWQHVRLAGLAAGSSDFSSTAKAGLPANAEGGSLGLQMTPPIKGLSGSYYLCSSGINAKLAQQLDVSLDDGQGDKGSMRAQSTGGTDATKEGESYADGKIYTVCMAF